MPVESTEDLAGFFDADEFADEDLWAYIGGVAVPFTGIFTEAHLAEQPGTTPDISVMVPRIIAARASVPDIRQGDTVERKGVTYLVNDLHFKRDLVIIHLHDQW